MISFYFIRHGQTIWNHSGRYQGITDVALNKMGYAQAECVPRFFSETKLDAIYASDLTRALSTAIPTAYQQGLPIQLSSGLREINFGDWEGLTYDQINQTWPGSIEYMYEHAKTVRISNGESFGDVQDRARRVLDDIIKKQEGDQVAIFSHGGTIRCMICALLGFDLDFAWQFKQDNANVTTIHYYGKRNLLVGLNDVHHLKTL